MESKIQLIGCSGKAGSGKDLVGKIIQYLTQLHTVPEDIDKDRYWRDMSFENFCKDKQLASFSSWRIKKFATKVKEVCSLLTRIPVEDFEKEEVKQRYLGKEWNRYIQYKEKRIVSTTRPYPHIPLESMTVRQLLQEIGTDAMRDVIHPDVWVNALMKDYKAYKPVVTDIPLKKFHLADEPEYPNWLVTDVRFPNEAKAIKDRQGIVVRVNRNPKNKWIDKEEWDFKTKGIQPHESETALDDYKFDYVIENDSDIPSLIEKVREMLKHYNLL